MKRNTSLLVNRINDHYDIIIPNPQNGGKLFMTTKPYCNQAETEYLCDITGNEIVLPDPLEGKRIYFIVKNPDGSETLAGDRSVIMPGVDNCRDQGGYLTEDGKTVKWGRFFRGSPLFSFNKQGRTEDAAGKDGVRKYVEHMQIKSILDYREPREADSAPDYVPNNSTYHMLHAMGVLEQPNTDNLAAVKSLDEQISQVKNQNQADEIFTIFTSMYALLPFNNPAYQKMFDSLDNDFPIYQHCTAGKDRTGVGCALLLLTLGVDRKTVLGDYCLSGPIRQKSNHRYIQSMDKTNLSEFAEKLLYRVFSVEESMLQSAFDAIDKKYPSFESFLLGEYNVTPQQIDYWRSIHLV